MSADRRRLERRRDRAVVLLAVNSGAIDALGLLALGGAFTSVMTGNLVLAGVGAATVDSALAVLSLAAIACFCVGCALGVRVAGLAAPADPVWPRPVTAALVVQLAVTAAFAGGWWVSGGDPDDETALLLLSLNALGLGIQSSSVQRFGIRGLSTTYLTGTLTTLVIELSTRAVAPTARRSATLLAALVAGAAAGGALTEHLPGAAPALPLACLVAALAVGVSCRRGPAETAGTEPTPGEVTSSGGAAPRPAGR